MRFVDTILVALTFASSASTGSHPAPVRLLRQVSETYHHLRSFEFGGHLTTTQPGTGIEIRVKTADAGGEYEEAKRFGKVNVTDTRGNPAKPVGFAMPGQWGNFDRIDLGVRRVTELPSETVRVNGAPIQCRVLQVVYDNEGLRPEEENTKYWIDESRLLVVKEQFTERQGRPSVSWNWLYSVDSIKLNQPPPQWLVQFQLSNQAPVDHPRPEWVGRTAPDFVLSDLKGHQVRSSSMRGLVVVLDFWATWCGPCRKELPIIQEIAEDYKSQDVQVWGISLDKEPSIVKQWMGDTQTKFRTMIDPESKTSDQYGVQGIPVIVVIGRSGRVVSYYEGNQPEQSLRSAIDLALREGARTTTGK